MAAPTNVSALTATLLATAPSTLTQRVDDSGTVYTVWFQYLASAADTFLSVFALGSTDLSTYVPAITVWTGPAASPVRYLFMFGSDRPIQFAVTAGTTYYFEVTPDVGGMPSPLTMSVESLPTFVAAPIGSLLVNDDTTGYPATVQSGVDPFVLYGAVPAIVPSESMDINADQIAVVDADTGGVKLYTPQGALSVDVANPFGAVEVALVRANPTTGAFWIGSDGSPSAHSVVRSLAADGTVGSTAYTLDDGLSGMALSPDDTILYYTSGGTANAIKRWDLVNNVQLSDLAAGTANFGSRRLLSLPDGSVVVALEGGITHGALAKRYSASGTLLTTYTPVSSDGTDLRLASCPDPSLFLFWVKILDADAQEGLSQFLTIKATTGATTTITRRQYEEGIYVGAATLTPVRFGHSESCDVVVLRSPMGPVPAFAPVGGPQPWPLTPPFDGLTSIPIRRVRRGPHIVDEQKMIFLDTLQPDLQPGIGAVTGQGLTATVMLRMSKDGGHTWGGWRTTSAGALGRYLTRIRFVRFGQARDWVPEIAVSDPVVPWVVLQLIWQGTEGTS